MHSIFKIGISRNMKCAYMVGFLKYTVTYYTSINACPSVPQSAIYRTIATICVAMVAAHGCCVATMRIS